MKKRVGLRRRWFLNTVGVVCTLGLACVLAATAVFAYFQYSNLEAALRYSAQSTVDALDKLPMGDADQLGNYFKNISAFARGNEQQHQLFQSQYPPYQVQLYTYHSQYLRRQYSELPYQ